MTRTNYNGIDLMKFLGAIMVFIIHISPFGENAVGVRRCINFLLQQYLCRLAVPFYFAASGFFLFQKMSPGEIRQESIREYCFKILKLLGIWHSLLTADINGHLWYLGATVVAVLMLSFCFKRRIPLGWIYAIAGVLYAVGLLGDLYYGLLEPLMGIRLVRYLVKGYERFFVTTRNGAFMGFLFVLMGANFALKRITVKPITALAGLTVSMICMLVEIILLHNNHIPKGYNMGIFLVPATFFLFSLVSAVRLKDSPIYKHLRNMGVIIYFSHLLVNKCVLLAMSFLQQALGPSVWQYSFAASLLCVVAFAAAVEWLSTSRLKCLRWLYT